jgi:hypothetical protein
LKKIIVPLLLLACGQALASCDEDFANGKLNSVCGQSFASECEEDFARFKQTATNTLPANLRAEIAPMTLEIGEFDDRLHADGASQSSNLHIKVSCKADPETNAAVIAHEIGHVVTFILHPGMRRDVTTGYKAISYSVQERSANEFAAKIFTQSNKSSAPYLKILDELCTQRNEYFCERAKAWRGGLIG